MTDTSSTRADTTPPTLASDTPGVGTKAADGASAKPKAPARPAAAIRGSTAASNWAKFSANMPASRRAVSS